MYFEYTPSKAYEQRSELPIQHLLYFLRFWFSSSKTSSETFDLSMLQAIFWKKDHMKILQDVMINEAGFQIKFSGFRNH